MAETLFDSFGTNTSGAWTATWDVLSFRDPVNIASGLGASFTLMPGTYSLSSVTFALGLSDGTNNLAISLQSDNGGLPSGVPIETLASHPTEVSNLNQIVTYGSSFSPVLAGGVKYWLVLEPIDLNLTNSANNTLYEWYAQGSLGQVAGKGFNFSTEKWDSWGLFGTPLLPAFRIDGFAVPEPNAFSLVVLGAALFGIRWCRSIFGSRRQTS